MSMYLHTHTRARAHTHTVWRLPIYTPESLGIHLSGLSPRNFWQKNNITSFMGRAPASASTLGFPWGCWKGSYTLVVPGAGDPAEAAISFIFRGWCIFSVTEQTTFPRPKDVLHEVRAKTSPTPLSLYRFIHLSKPINSLIPLFNKYLWSVYWMCYCSGHRGWAVSKVDEVPPLMTLLSYRDDQK